MIITRPSLGSDNLSLVFGLLLLPLLIIALVIATPFWRDQSLGSLPPASTSRQVAAGSTGVEPSNAQSFFARVAGFFERGDERDQTSQPTANEGLSAQPAPQTQIQAPTPASKPAEPSGSELGSIAQEVPSPPLAPIAGASSNFDADEDSIADLLSAISSGSTQSELALEQAEPAPSALTSTPAPLGNEADGIGSLLAVLGGGTTGVGAEPEAQSEAAPDLAALGFPSDLNAPAADTENAAAGGIQTVPETPAPSSAATASPSTASSLPVTPGLAALPVQADPGAGGADWNRRFPWIGVAPFLVEGVNPVENPNLPPPLVANVNSGLTNETPSATTEGSAGLPRSFIMRRSEDATAAPTRPALPALPPAETASSAPASRDIAAEVTAYGREVATIIAQNLTYPPEFRAQALEGTVRLGVSLRTNGDLIDSTVLKSSDVVAIDQAARNIVSRLDFPTPPAGATEQQLRFGVEMRFVPPQ